MNNFILNSLVNHLSPVFTDSRIEEVFASYSGISFRTASGELFFSMISDVPLLLSLEQKKISAGPLPQKGGKLNQFLKNAIITRIGKHLDDRIVHFVIQKPEATEYNLYYIAVPRKAELVLADSSNKILYRTHFDFEHSDIFQLEHQNDDGFHQISGETLVQLITSDTTTTENLISDVAGLDNALASMFINLRNEDREKLTTLITLLQNQAYNLVIINSKTEAVDLIPQPLAMLQGSDFQDFPDDNLAATAFFREKARLFELASIKKELKQVVSKRSKKIKTIRKKLNQDLEKTRSNLDAGHLGDLILANLHLIKRGMDSVEVQNYFSENLENISIRLDPLLAPQENADRYYNKARKARRGIEALEARQLEQDKQQAELDQIKKEIEEAGEKLHELRKIHKVFIARKWLTQAQKKRLKIKTLPGKRFISSEGFEIIVGKNSRENEIVSFQVGKENDFWMHAAGCPGSHVVLRNPLKKDDPPEVSLHEAAAIAAWYSKAKNSKNVQVHWTKRRFIKKVKGGTPGKVLLSAYSSVIVNPEIPGSVTQNDT